MSETEPFYARRRLKELRSMIRNTDDFSHTGPVHNAMVTLLADLANDLASRAEADHEDAHYFVIRCMGAIAQANADAAYKPYGYINPFKDALPLPETPLWKWPVVDQPPSYGGSTLDPEVWREFSALKMYGYTVGKTNGWLQAKRENFLTDFMEMELPPLVQSHFGNEYGAKMTTVRLRKVANLIAGNANNFRRNNAVQYAAAIADWESDLAFLKKKYYYGAKLAFEPWPSTQSM